MGLPPPVEPLAPLMELLTPMVEPPAALMELLAWMVEPLAPQVEPQLPPVELSWRLQALALSAHLG